MMWMLPMPPECRSSLVALLIPNLGSYWRIQFQHEVRDWLLSVRQSGDLQVAKDWSNRSRQNLSISELMTANSPYMPIHTHKISDEDLKRWYFKLVDFKIPPPEKPVLMASASGRSASEPKSPKCSWMAWTKTSSQQMSCQLQVGDGKRPTGSWSRSVHHYTVPYRLTIIWGDRRVNKLEGSHKLHRSIQNDDVDTCIVSTWIVEENCDVPCQDRSNDTHASTQQESSKHTMKHKPKVPLTLKLLNMRLVRTKLTRHSDFSSSFSLAETTRCCLSPCFSQGFNPAWEQDA